MKIMSDEVQSPAKWVKILQERGINISERTLRSKARKHGQFYAVGQKMILHPFHIDTIFEREAKEQIQLDARQSKGRAR